EGDVTLETSEGAQSYAEIGDAVNVGDTLYTAKDSLAEISLQGGSTVTIEAGSVFNVDEVAAPEIETRKRSFFRVVLGAVSFKFRNITDEPEVGTNITVCSVRGTDFTVYSAPDGASLTVVSDGLVEVTSGGASALLPAGAGVEAVVGLGLGEPFEAKKGVYRYDQFVEESFKRMDDDPIGQLSAITETLIQYAKDGAYYLDAWNTNYDEVNAQRQIASEIREKDGADAAEEFEIEKIIPLQYRSLDLNRTYRYHFLSGLFLRRYILSGYYLRVRTRFMNDTENQQWMDFLEAYTNVLQTYENFIVSNLDDEDF
ncbi:MAG: FecR family protein, partial [Spirochaetaceae bacterium]|nr:FecR family protein [Spirochaetaceae bacterium]